MAVGVDRGGRRSRFWLFAPFVLLVLVAAGWSAAWFVVRGRVAEGLDAALAREARAGRQWTCADRRIAGFPFRIEISCSTLRLARGPTTMSLGQVRAVAQVYQPRRVIVESTGPLQAGEGDARLDAQWRLLQASLHLTQGGFQRASLAIDDVRLRVTGVEPGEIAGSAQRLEAHVRPHPVRFASEGAYDVAVSAAKAAVPLVDALIGGEEPLDLTVDAVLARARVALGGPPVQALERWRQAGGALDLTRVTATKGGRRVEVKGTLMLDDARRPAGRLEIAAAGIEDLVARLAGVRSGAAAGGNVAGAPAAQARANPSRPAERKLAQLPPLRLENGRVFLGPLPLPGVRLSPLY